MHYSKEFLAFCLIFLRALLCCAGALLPVAFSPENSAFAQNEGRGTDPLTLAEESRAVTIGQSSSRLMLIKDAAAIHKTQVRGLNPVQFLYAQLHLEAPSDQSKSRLADVFYYNFATDEVLQQIVDLQKGIIREETVFTGLAHQPYITPLETEAAFQMLLDHAKFGPALRSIYSKTNSKPLRASDQMRAQAGLFYPSSKVGTPQEEITRSCETHRCVQIFLHAGDGTLIDTNNIILDLSAGVVLWR